MPFSSKQNLLFIHIPKNAGKSIESAFEMVSDSLIANPRTRSSLNLFSKWLLNITQRDEFRRSLFGAFDYVLCAQHLTVNEILSLNLVPYEKFRAAFKFAIVRNPYDRALSTFRHFSGANPDLGEFKEFWSGESVGHSLDHNFLAHMRRQSEFVLDQWGEIAVNKILRYENLAADFTEMCEEWSLIHKGLGEIRTHEKLDYRTFYDAEAAKLILKRFRQDFEFFGYHEDFQKREYV